MSPHVEEEAMLEALIDKFAQIEDPRCDWRVEHKLLDILVIAVCAPRVALSHRRHQFVTRRHADPPHVCPRR